MEPSHSSVAKGEAAPDGVCRPRVRKCLLAVGPEGAGGDILAHTAERLGTRLNRVAELDVAAAYMAHAPVSCVVLTPSRPGDDPLIAIERLTIARSDLPIVVLDTEVDDRLAMAAIQTGAQDYLVAGETDAAALERSIRYAIDRKRIRVQLEHLALHDPLTGLPNRSLFSDRLEQALTRRERNGGGVALLFIDIDGLKRINDNLGHAAGDEVLREAASRIRSAVRSADTVARFGADQFTVVCEDVLDERAALAGADRVLQELGRPLSIGGAEVVPRSSVGVALALEGSGSDLLRDADDAMLRAKRRGGGRAELFDPGQRAGTNEIELEAELRRAIPDELHVLYQPKVRMEDGSLIGAEALVRWRHPERGLVSPAEFIPVAEQSGLIVPIGAWVLTRACEEAARWNDQNATPLQISVNVSARQFTDPGLAASVREALESSGLPPERLQLELTETILMEDLEHNAATLAGLKELGVSLGLDDFGKGYSSLSYLKRFPVDTIKIDRSFVSGVPDSREDVAIVAAVLSFARALEMAVIAEGVETQAHVDALVDMGCEFAQGFHFHRPIEPEAVRALCAE